MGLDEWAGRKNGWEQSGRRKQGGRSSGSMSSYATHCWSMRFVHGVEDKYWRTWSGRLFVISKLGEQRRQWHPTPVLLPGKSHGWRSLVGYSPWGRYESDTTERLHFYALEKKMATHSSVLAWRIPGTGEPGGLLSMGSHRVEHNWSDLAAAAAAAAAAD